MRAAGFLLATMIAVSGCALLAKTVHYERGGNFDMPDVTGMTAGQAKDKLATSGITGSVSVVDNYTCDDEAVAVDHVCYTSPRKGNGTSARIPVTLYTRPKPTSMDMPDVIGKTEQQGRQILVGYGFKRIEVEVIGDEDVPDDCAPRTICATSPPPGQGASFDVVKVLYVAPATKKVKPVKPRQSEPTVDTDGDDPEPEQKKPEKPEKPEKPKEEPAEPIF